jgi:uncharacterized membrane protein YoaK (UPF0700 family)
MTWSAISRRDCLLVALTFAAGCVDGISYLGLGRVFTANMTGNAVLLGLAIGQTEELRVVHAAVALGFFILGVMLGARLVGGGQERILWSRRITFALAVEFVLLGGFAVAWWIIGAEPAGSELDVLIAMAALAMGLQSAAARRCAVSGVSTTYITGTLTGLMAELAAFAGAPSDWGRLIGVLAALVAGAVVGGLAHIHFPVWSAIVPAAVLGMVVIVAAGLHSSDVPHGSRG